MRFRLPLRLPLRPSVAIILASASLLWLFDLLVAARRDVSRSDLLVIIAFCAAVVLAQSLIVAAVRRLAAPLFVLFGVADAYSLHFVFSGRITAYPLAVQAALLLAVAALYFVVYRVIVEFSGLRGWLVGSLTLGVVLLGAFGVAPIAAGPGRYKATHEFPGLRLVEFKRRPNIYFLGNDALMPPRLTDELLHLENLPYVDVIRRHGGRIIPNLFADQVPTQSFWATTMNIFPARGKPADLVTGIRPSPLLATFQHNGYDTHFLFWSAYFGPNRGPLLTTYDVLTPYSTCTFLDDLPKRFGLFGYCKARTKVSWLSPEASGPVARDLPQAYLERLRAVTRGPRSRPQFYAAHFPLPGHTKLAYNRTASQYEEYREQYRRRSAQVADLLDRELSEIQSADPTAIIYVFGDHGPWTSRFLHYADDPAFVVRDRHGIMGALFGAESCMPYLQPPPGERIQTSSRIIVGLLQCLAGGESPLVGAHDFGHIDQAPGNMRFETYAYE